MPNPLVTDELWTLVEPLLPEQPPKPKGGRPRVNDRAALTGILFVLKTGIPWGMLPQEMGCGSGMTCWRRLKEWHQAGVWEHLHESWLDRLGEADRIDWSRASLDSRGEKTGPNPTDRGKQGSKRHLVVDRNGVPLAVRHTAANVHDSKALEDLVDATTPMDAPRQEKKERNFSNVRRRTRGAMIEAATRLVREGASPSVTEVADAAGGPW